MEKFGVDTMRLALADSGDGMEDANFDEKLGNANVLRVHTHTLLSWSDVRLPIFVFDSWLMLSPFTYSTKCGFMNSTFARDWYREVTQDTRRFVKYCIRVHAILASPIAPRFAEHVYCVILQSPTSTCTVAYSQGASDAEAALLKMLRKTKPKKERREDFRSEVAEEPEDLCCNFVPEVARYLRADRQGSL